MIDIKVEVNGSIVKPITSLKLNKSLVDCADDFSLTVVFNYNDKKLFEPFKFQNIRIIFDDTIVCGGYIEALSTSIKSQTISLQGRSFTGQLIDCSFNSSYSFKKTTLGNVAKTICSPFGIKVSLPLGDSQASENIYLNVNDTAFKALNYFATQSTLPKGMPILTADNEGQLVIGKNIITGSPCANFIEGEGKLIECKAIYNSTARYSLYKAFGQSSIDENVIGEVEDKTISINRIKKMETNGTTVDECKAVAEREKALDIISSTKIVLRTDGFTDKQNNIYEAGKSVTLKAPSCFIFDEKEFIIQAVSFNYSKSGYNTELSLVLPESYTRTNKAQSPAESTGRY